MKGSSWLVRFGNSKPAPADAGDLQANGFQVNVDANPFGTITESGASCMGFAASPLLAAAAAGDPRYMVVFSGDGSCMM